MDWVDSDRTDAANGSDQNTKAGVYDTIWVDGVRPRHRTLRMLTILM